MIAEVHRESQRVPVPLDDRLSELSREERQRAMRALLQNPLLTADGVTATEFGLVRRHAEELKEWLAHHANWTLHVTSEFARLRKIPPDSTDWTRAARDNRTDAAFTRNRYVLLCLALAALERGERQTTLGKLAEAMVGFFAADPSLKAAGLSSDLKSMDQRRDLVQVIRFLCDRRVLWRRQGDEDLFIKDARNDVLYNVNRPLLAAMLCVQRGPSTVGSTNFEERLAAITEESLPDTEDGQNRQIRIRLMRRLLDDPVLYYDALSEREHAYLDRQRGFMLPQITEMIGLIPEIRAEGIALVNSRSDLADVSLPEEGTDGHLTLLIAEFLTTRLRENSNTIVGIAELSAHIAHLVNEHRSHWRKDVTAPGADRVLTENTIDRLEALRLLRRVPGGVQPLAALARYSLAEELKETTTPDPTLF